MSDLSTSWLTSLANNCNNFYVIIFIGWQNFTPTHNGSRSRVRTIVTEAISNYTPNRVLGTPPPDISPLESFLPRPVRTTLAQLRLGHCWLLKSYMARITTGVSDVCPECGVAPHSVEHLFNCSVHPTQLTVQDLWDNLAEVADFLNLDSWRQWTRREELLGYHNNNNRTIVPSYYCIRL